jgi:hypothetical protein
VLPHVLCTTRRCWQCDAATAEPCPIHDLKYRCHISEGCLMVAFDGMVMTRIRLSGKTPGDIDILSPTFDNVLKLQPCSHHLELCTGCAQRPPPLDIILHNPRCGACGACDIATYYRAAQTSDAPAMWKYQGPYGRVLGMGADRRGHQNGHDLELHGGRDVLFTDHHASRCDVCDIFTATDGKLLCACHHNQPCTLPDCIFRVKNHGTVRVVLPPPFACTNCHSLNPTSSHAFQFGRGIRCTRCVSTCQLCGSWYPVATSDGVRSYQVCRSCNSSHVTDFIHTTPLSDEIRDIYS